jgi:hypothetical protein
MKSKARIDSGHNQMRWVVLLLAVAVILPTVGLLWFITQVINNERLAVRQKLITVYKEQLEKTLRQANSKPSEYYELLDNKEIQINPYLKKFFVDWHKNFSGLLIYNAEGQRVYPLLSCEIEGAAEVSELFKDAWGA